MWRSLQAAKCPRGNHTVGLIPAKVTADSWLKFFTIEQEVGGEEVLETPAGMDLLFDFLSLRSKLRVKVHERLKGQSPNGSETLLEDIMTTREEIACTALKGGALFSVVSLKVCGLQVREG